MAWTTPKTDWTAEDFFNVADYNRIKNNLAYLCEVGMMLYGNFDIAELGIDKNLGDFFTAGNIDAWEYDLDQVNTNTVDQDYGVTPRYNANDKMPNYAELNRIESASLSLYTYFTNQIDGRRHFVWHLGDEGGMF